MIVVWKLVENVEYSAARHHGITMGLDGNNGIILFEAKCTAQHTGLYRDRQECPAETSEPSHAPS